MIEGILISLQTGGRGGKLHPSVTHVDIDDPVIPSIIHLLPQCTVSTPEHEDSCLLAIRHIRFQDWDQIRRLEEPVERRLGAFSE